MRTIAEALTNTTRFHWVDAPQELASKLDSAIGIVQRGNAALPFQVLLANWKSDRDPTKDICRTLFSRYRDKKAFPLVVTLVNPTGLTWCYGPSEDGIVEGPFEDHQIARTLAAAFSESNASSARSVMVHYFDSLRTSAMPGVTNTGLFASYYLRDSAPDRKDFGTSAESAKGLVSHRGESLIRELGFQSTLSGSTALILSSRNDVNRAVAVLLERTETYSEATARFNNSSPVAHGLALAQSKEIPWLIALKGSQIRLYSAKTTEGVGRKGQSETYLEIDLAVVDDRYAPLLPLIFSAEALGPRGSTQELLNESARYAVGLGKRLRSRVYEEVVPGLSVAVARALRNRGVQLDVRGLDLAYGATLRILFRLLFQAYGEDRGLLPYAKNDIYDRHALKTIAQELLSQAESTHDDDSDSYWRELSTAWRVIDKGDHSWGVPAYNGGLFSSDDPEGKSLSDISLSNAVLLPALRALLVDTSEDGKLGPVDFRSLSVREFGTIYEGLLESSLSLAESDLTLDKSGTWMTAKPGDKVEASADEPYFHNASGARKATGSYFTPSFLVDHLIERSVNPALDEHLAKVQEALDSGDEPQAAQLFFDFRICDLAMGSGHFLISAIDHIEARLSAFLHHSPIPKVTEELVSLEHAARRALGELSADTEIEQSSLLRRQIAKRCVYGLDVNKIAVELSRVAIWIHTFVPGLAMSSLEHGLVHGNSLTGIGRLDEALSELDPPKKGRSPGVTSVFRQEIEDALNEASDLLKDAASAAEATSVDVARAAELARSARAKAEPSKELFDAAVLMRLGKIPSEYGTDPDVLSRNVSNSELSSILNQLQPAHMPYLFPEVFLRENGGFDVLVGNPPWEKVKVEEKVWWGLRIPGLRSMPQELKNQKIAEMKATRLDLVSLYKQDVANADFMRAVISKGPYPGIGSGDIDLFQAFAWRNLNLLRSGGYSGVVLPRSALAGSGTKLWREEVLDHARFAQVTLLTNSRHWVFEDVHPQYNVALVVIQQSHEDIVHFVGPFTNRDAFDSGSNETVSVKTSDFKSWSSTYVFPWLPDKASVEVFLKLRSHPRFDATDGLAFRLATELHTTANKQFYDFDLKNPSGDLSVWTGGSFDIWNPDHGDPYAYAKSQEVLPFLEAKLANQRNNRRSAFYGLKDEVLTPRPWERARIAFRDVTNSTNTRTMITCLLPPKALLVHKAPYLFRSLGNASSEAYLIGLLSSIPFDWYARRFVELAMSFELLNPMPLPRPKLDDPLRNRVIEIAGRLAAIDERYSDWAKDVGVPVGTVKTKSEKDDLISELDAVVSHLYGLTEKELIHVFRTFHVGWDYQSRLDATLLHFRAWSSR